MQPATPTDDLSPSEQRLSRILAVAAFLSWGLLPIYWKALGEVPATQILCHRIVWSAGFTALVLTLANRWGETLAAVRQGRTALLLLVGSCLVSVNWLIYIWAVNNDHVLESSLGYYLTPLVNATLGMVVLRERLRGLQMAAVALAAVGVANLVFAYGRFPWIALSLALTFGSYGLLRKKVQVKPIPGLFWETLGVTLPALVYLVWAEYAGVGAFGHAGTATTLLLAGAGVVTALPLLWFAGAARRMRLTTLGLFQYIAPTCFFSLGVFVYGEPFTSAHAVTFGCIWAGIALYTLSGLRALRRIHPPA